MLSLDAVMIENSKTTCFKINLLLLGEGKQSYWVSDSVCSTGCQTAVSDAVQWCVPEAATSVWGYNGGVKMLQTNHLMIQKAAAT